MRKKTGSVLVVDDDPSVLESSSLLLSEYGYDVISSPSAQDAIAQFKPENVDAIVTDIVMPSMSGIELLRQIHDIDPATPVILMTAYADMEKVIGAIKTGAFDFIIKPFTAELLIHAVEKAVQFNRLAGMEREYRLLLEEYNQKIEALVTERTMSVMALTLADRIRNPTSVIGLTCKRMLDKEEMPEQLKPKLLRIAEEAKKLDAIVAEFESLQKDRKSMFTYEDINDVVKGVIPLIENMTASRGVSIHFRPSEFPLKVNIQKSLFQIALSHLIKNAAEATARGGEITVSAYAGDNAHVIEVSDTGYGISADDLNKIFTPVYSSKDKRFGMGLPLIKRIVSEHMGKIDVSSKPGEGTTFKISLPLRWRADK